MQLTPFGRIDIALEDLPRIDFRAPVQRRSEVGRVPDAPTRESGGETGHRSFEAVQAEAGPAPQVATPAPPPARPASSVADATRPQDPELATDGSEGAAAVLVRPEPDEVRAGGPGPRPTPTQARSRADAGAQAQVPLPELGAQGAAAPTPPTAVPAQVGTTVEAASASRGNGAAPQGAFATLAARTTPRPVAHGEAAAPPRPRAPIQLASQERRSILESVSLALGEGRGEAVLHLDPAELGSLSIRLALEGNRLVLRMSAERDEVAQALRDALPELSELLAAQGLRVEDYEVRSGSRDEHFQEAAEFRRSHAAAGRSLRTDDTPEAARPRVRLVTGTGIDYFA